LAATSGFFDLARSTSTITRHEVATISISLGAQRDAVHGKVETQRRKVGSKEVL
jgi:hypothetical protein